jgi:hypothetical protein
MKRWLRSTALACAALPGLLGGCALWPTSPADSGQQRAGMIERQVFALASYADTLAQLSPESQRQELAEAEAAFAAEPGSEQRLRLALVLALADREVRDLDRARELVSEPAFDTGYPAYTGVSMLVRAIAATGQAEQAQSDLALAAAQLECQGGRDAAHRHQVERLEGLLEDEQARCALLEAQFHELKDIERRIHEQSQPSRLLPDDEADTTKNPPR